MKKKKNTIGEKIVKKILTIAVQERSFNFDNIELRIVETSKGIETASIGIAGKPPSLFFTEQQLCDLHESLDNYFKRR